MRMTSAEERQEVAARLKSLIPDVNGMRDLAAYLDCWVGVEDSDVDCLYRVETDRKAAKMTLEKLADLIDPVCHMTNATLNKGFGVWGCICSECGANIEYTRAKSLNYCPHCGARVVND